MKFPVAAEFTREFVYSNIVTLDPYNPNARNATSPSVVTVDLPRLTTEYPRPNAPPGSDRMICRTVGALVRLELLTKPPPPPLLPFPAPPGIHARTWTLLATAALMGTSGGKVGIIQQHTLGPVPLGYETTGFINGPDPLALGNVLSIFTAANMSAGAYGFDYLTSYSNLMDSIFIRVQVTRGNSSESIDLEGPEYYFHAPVKLRVKGVVLAGDPA